jgi:glutathione S-transferase
VRYALGIRGAAYTTVEIGDNDTQKVIDISGQPLTPMLKHGDTVTFDSAAIVRYIDANILGPKLFSSNLDEMRAIESWESRTRAEILNPYLQMIGQVRSGSMDETIIAQCKAVFMQGASHVESALNEHGFLIGERLTAADIFCGCYLAYGFLTAQEAGSRPLSLWALKNIALAPSHPKLSVWFEQLRAVDKV